MSCRLWQQRFGSDRSIVGSAVEIDNKPFTIVGITPPGFFGDTLRNTPPDYFLPLSTEPLLEAEADLKQPNVHWLDLIGRIPHGILPRAVEAQMRVELKHWLLSHWGEMSASDQAKFPEQTLFLSPGGAGITSMRQEYEHWLGILMMVSGFVLVIVCANVANLFLVRNIERRPQLSLSVALGAQSMRLIIQALSECILLSLVGGAAGVGIAFTGARLIVHFAFPGTAGMGNIPIEAGPSIPILIFALLISLLTGVAFGAVPAWMATRIDAIEALRGANRSTARAGTLPRKALVVLQAAISLALLSAAGLLTATLNRMEKQDFGFDQERRIIASLNPQLAGYRPEQLTPLYRRIHDAFLKIPGVEAVALCTYSPQNGDRWGSTVWIAGRPVPGPREDNSAFWNRVTPGFFDVIGNPIVQGRGITKQDSETSRHVAVINEAFAHRFSATSIPLAGTSGDMTWHLNDSTRSSAWSKMHAP